MLKCIKNALKHLSFTFGKLINDLCHLYSTQYPVLVQTLVSGALNVQDTHTVSHAGAVIREPESVVTPEATDSGAPVESSYSSGRPPTRNKAQLSLMMFHPQLRIFEQIMKTYLEFLVWPKSCYI